MMTERPPELQFGRVPVPLYRQMADWLRERILAGDFEPGTEPFPSEPALCEMFGVSVDTARAAKRALRQEGLIYTVPKRGTYVRRRRGGRRYS